jgi:hypothetical protein
MHKKKKKKCTLWFNVLAGSTTGIICCLHSFFKLYDYVMLELQYVGMNLQILLISF